MYRKREAKIADAIRTDSSRDRIFSYIVLFVISLLAVITGFILSELINSLSKNMEKTTSNINTMASEMVLMRKDISQMSHHIKSLDGSVINMSSDMKQMGKDVGSMSTNMDKMTKNTKDMKKDMKDFNKLNPMSLF